MNTIQQKKITLENIEMCESGFVSILSSNKKIIKERGLEKFVKKTHIEFMKKIMHTKKLCENYEEMSRSGKISNMSVEIIKCVENFTIEFQKIIVKQNSGKKKYDKLITSCTDLLKQWIVLQVKASQQVKLRGNKFSTELDLLIEEMTKMTTIRHQKYSQWNKKLEKLQLELSAIIKQTKNELKENSRQKEKQRKGKKVKQFKISNNANLKKDFTILELGDSVSFNEIQTAYRELIKFYHPDNFQQKPDSLKRSERKTKEIINAYENLKKEFKQSI